MHSAAAAAKHAAISDATPGNTGHNLHQTTAQTLKDHGYQTANDADNTSQPAMIHGTGHGIGLDVHEPPLLDNHGPELVPGDCLTIEPGLYHKHTAGIRPEDMVIVTNDAPKNLNTLPETLNWAD